MIKRNGNLDLLSLQIMDQIFDENNSNHLELLNQLSIQTIINNNGSLPDIPPFEKHPYIEDLIPNDKISGLMIGTFPPITYLCSSLSLASLTYEDQRFTSPVIDYFHGNYSSLWKYAPINFEIITLQPREHQPELIKNAINNSGIEYTDIIKYTQRCLNKQGKYDASDINLESIVLNNQVFDYLFQSNSINRIYFTNASFYTKNNNLLSVNNILRLAENDAFGLFIKAGLDLGIVIHYSLYNDNLNWVRLNENNLITQIRRMINNQLHSKTTLKIRMELNGIVKEYEICSSVSPAAVNRGAHRNPCIISYGERNGYTEVRAANEFLRYTLTCFFNNELNNLRDYNS